MTIDALLPNDTDMFFGWIRFLLKEVNQTNGVFGK